MRLREGRRTVAYTTWLNMRRRCSSKSLHQKHPTYAACTFCDEWDYFETFRAWMETQDWQGKQLDKDILVPGNKIYSPETCCFVSQQVNKFMFNIGTQGRRLTGAYWSVDECAFFSVCSNPFTCKSERLGLFPTEQEAHEAWRRRKHELACRYADMQSDPRVAEALRTRFVVLT